MTTKDSFHINDQDLIRVSSFLSNASKVFKENSFVKNFGYLDLFFYIYKNDKLLNQSVRFKDLSIYSSKSDVYLTKFLKNGVESGYLTFTKNKQDKRIKNYHITDKSKPFLNAISNFEKLG